MLLTTHQLCRSFGGLRAVDGVDLSLRAGEIRAIIGPNGAGKTTLVSLICGRIAPTTGRIVFEDADITKLPAYDRVERGIAYTFQITSVFANLSAADNVALAAQRALLRERSGIAIDRAALRERVEEALEQVRLSDWRQARAGALAYGHQRLLEIAMGLALKPKLLILDEPTQGLADGEIAEFVSLVRSIAEQATILLIEHNMAVVMDLAQAITVLDRGRILAEGAPGDIRENDAVQRAYLGT